MADYTDLYNIEHTGEPFSARFIKKHSSELPFDCILPDELNSIPTLPTIDIILPELECRFDLDEPVVPPPYFCTPKVDGEITMSVCGESQGITITGSAGISRKPETECDFELSGNFEFCMPCVPSFGGGISFHSCTIDGKNSTRVNVPTPIGITYDASTCQYTLDGEVEICTPCIPKMGGGISFNTCEINGRNSARVSAVEPVAVEYDDETCMYQLKGSVEICAPCIPIFNTNIDVKSPPNGRPAVSVTPATFEYDESACSWLLKGGYDIECIPEFEANVKMNIIDPNGILNGNANLTWGDSAGGCLKKLEGQIDLGLGCVMQQILVGNVTAKNMIQGQTSPYIDMTVDCQGQGGCCNNGTINMELEVAACSEVEIKVGDDAEFNIPIKWGDHDVGNIELTVRYYIEDDNECTKTLKLEATGYSASLNLPTTTLSLCGGDGSSESVQVLIPPGSSGGGQE